MDGLSPERVDELLERMADACALVVGDVMLDRYVSGPVDRVSPEAPVPVVRVAEERSAIGGAANVAANVRALGGGCRLVGCVGEDAPARELVEALDALGVDSRGVTCTPDRPTTVKTRVLGGHQQIVRVDREVEDDVTGRLADDLAHAVRELASGCDVLVIQDYNKGTLAPPVVDAALEAAARLAVPSVVDPKRRGFFRYPGVTVFKPNARELEDALGEFLHPDDQAWMEGTRLRLDCEHLLVTLGSRGLVVQSREGGSLRLAAIAKGVYDVSGAGDTVTAAVALALAAGARMEEAAILANHAAALEVAKPGVQTVSPSELRDHVKAFGHPHPSTSPEE